MIALLKEFMLLCKDLYCFSWFVKFTLYDIFLSYPLSRKLTTFHCIAKFDSITYISVGCFFLFDFCSFRIWF